MANYLIVGNSSGIGYALSQQLLEQGNYILGMSRRPADNVSVMHCVDVVAQDLPPINMPLDGIVYCPGSIVLKPFRAMKADQYQSDFNINVLGAIRVLQQYLPNLQEQPTASVVVFSSVAASVGMPYHASVAISKGALQSLTKSLAAEWAPKIRVNCIAPSLTDTPLAHRLIDTDVKRAAAGDRHPLKQVGESADVAAMAAYLLSPHAKFITGQIFNLDGGISTIR